MDNRAFSLPRQLIRRFETRDPFEIAEKMGITVLIRSDFNRQKGAFAVIGNISFIFINGRLSEYMQRLVLEINGAKNYIASLEDKVEEQKQELERRQDIIDEAAMVVKSLLDADSGADLHDITEHVLRLFGTESKPTSV